MGPGGRPQARTVFSTDQAVELDFDLEKPVPSRLNPQPAQPCVAVVPQVARPPRFRPSRAAAAATAAVAGAIGNAARRAGRFLTRRLARPCAKAASTAVAVPARAVARLGVSTAGACSRAASHAAAQSGRLYRTLRRIRVRSALATPLRGTAALARLLARKAASLRRGAPTFVAAPVGGSLLPGQPDPNQQQSPPSGSAPHQPLATPPRSLGAAVLRAKSIADSPPPPPPKPPVPPRPYPNTTPSQPLANAQVTSPGPHAAVPAPVPTPPTPDQGSRDPQPSEPILPRASTARPYTAVTAVPLPPSSTASTTSRTPASAPATRQPRSEPHGRVRSVLSAAGGALMGAVSRGVGAVGRQLSRGPGHVVLVAARGVGGVGRYGGVAMLCAFYPRGCKLLVGGWLKALDVLCKPSALGTLLCRLMDGWLHTCSLHSTTPCLSKSLLGNTPTRATSH